MKGASSVPGAAFRARSAFPLILAALAALSGCAGGSAAYPKTSASETAPGTAPLAVSLSTADEIEASYGPTYATNPFLEPPGIFSGGRSVFLVVRFLADAPRSLEIAGAELSGPEGPIKIQVLGRGELRRFWEERTVDDGNPATDARNDKRYAAIERYALDLDRPNALRKGSPYSLLLIASRAEAPEEATLIVRFIVDGVSAEESFPVEL